MKQFNFCMAVIAAVIIGFGVFSILVLAGILN
jgi:hypothetical protein